MVYPPPLRRRRRRRLLWLLVLGVSLTLIAVLVVQLRTDRRRVSDYLEVAGAAAETYKGLAADVETIVTDIERRDRQQMLATLAEAVTEADAAHRSLREAAPPAAAGPAGGYMLSASSAWRDALALLEGSITELLEDPQDRARVGLLETVFLDLRVGDRAYLRFLEAVAELDEDMVSFPLPEVSFVPATREVVYDAELFAGRLVALAELSARHDVAVADISFLPAPVGDDQGVPVIPVSETFEAQVTVTNRGNEPEEGIELEVLVVPLQGTSSVASETRAIEALGPGEAQTLSFPDLPIERGVMYELVARAQITDDADTESNEMRKVFIWSKSE